MMKMDKKSTVRPRKICHGLPGITRLQTAHVQRKRISQILKNKTIQAKFTIGQPNDKYEQEADHVADQVMSMPEHKAQRQELSKEEPELQRSPTTLDIQRLYPECEGEIQRQPSDEIEEKDPVQAKSLANKSTPVAAELQNQIQSFKSGGQSLPGSERAFFEHRFRSDFSNVRVQRLKSGAHCPIDQCACIYSWA